MAPPKLRGLLNYVAAQTISTLAIAPLGNGGKITIYNSSNTSIRVILDAAGYYLG